METNDQETKTIETNAAGCSGTTTELLNSEDNNTTLSINNKTSKKRKTKNPEEFFPWMKNINNSIRKSFRNFANRNTLKILQDFLKYIKEDSPNYVRYISKCQILSRNIVSIAFLLKNLNGDFDDSDEFLFKMSELLSHYTELELRVASKLGTPKSLVAEKISKTYNILLKNADNSFVIRIFLLMKEIHKQTEIMCQLFEKYLRPKSYLKTELPDRLYIMYLITLRKWKSIGCESDYPVILKYAQSLKPKSSFRYNTLYAPFLELNSVRDDQMSEHILFLSTIKRALYRNVIYGENLEVIPQIIDLSDDAQQDDTRCRIELNEILCTNKTNECTEIQFIKKEQQEIMDVIDLTDEQKFKDIEYIEVLIEKANKALRISNLMQKQTVVTEPEIICLDDDEEEEEIINSEADKNSNENENTELREKEVTESRENENTELRENENIELRESENVELGKNEATTKDNTCAQPVAMDLENNETPVSQDDVETTKQTEPNIESEKLKINSINNPLEISSDQNSNLLPESIVDVAETIVPSDSNKIMETTEQISTISREKELPTPAVVDKEKIQNITETVSTEKNTDSSNLIESEKRTSDKNVNENPDELENTSSLDVDRFFTDVLQHNNNSSNNELNESELIICNNNENESLVNRNSPELYLFRDREDVEREDYDVNSTKVDDVNNSVDAVVSEEDDEIRGIAQKISLPSLKTYERKKKVNITSSQDPPVFSPFSSEELSGSRSSSPIDVINESVNQDTNTDTDIMIPTISLNKNEKASENTVVFSASACTKLQQKKWKEPLKDQSAQNSQNSNVIFSTEKPLTTTLQQKNRSATSVSGQMHLIDSEIVQDESEDLRSPPVEHFSESDADEICQLIGKNLTKTKTSEIRIARESFLLKDGGKNNPISVKTGELDMRIEKKKTHDTHNENRYSSTTSLVAGNKRKSVSFADVTQERSSSVISLIDSFPDPLILDRKSYDSIESTSLLHPLYTSSSSINKLSSNQSTISSNYHHQRSTVKLEGGNNKFINQHNSSIQHHHTKATTSNNSNYGSAAAVAAAAAAIKPFTTQHSFNSGITTAADKKIHREKTSINRVRFSDVIVYKIRNNSHDSNNSNTSSRKGKNTNRKNNSLSSLDERKHRKLNLSDNNIFKMQNTAKTHSSLSPSLSLFNSKMNSNGTNVMSDFDRYLKEKKIIPKKSSLNSSNNNNNSTQQNTSFGAGYYNAINLNASLNSKLNLSKNRELIKSDKKINNLLNNDIKLKKKVVVKVIPLEILYPPFNFNSSNIKELKYECSRKYTVDSSDRNQLKILKGCPYNSHFEQIRSNVNDNNKRKCSESVIPLNDEIFQPFVKLKRLKSFSLDNLKQNNELNNKNEQEKEQNLTEYNDDSSSNYSNSNDNNCSSICTQQDTNATNCMTDIETNVSSSTLSASNIDMENSYDKNNLESKGKRVINYLNTINSEKHILEEFLSNNFVYKSHNKFQDLLSSSSNILLNSELLQTENDNMNNINKNSHDDDNNIAITPTSSEHENEVSSTQDIQNQFIENSTDLVINSNQIQLFESVQNNMVDTSNPSILYGAIPRKKSSGTGKILNSSNNWYSLFKNNNNNCNSNNISSNSNSNHRHLITNNSYLLDNEDTINIPSTTTQIEENKILKKKRGRPRKSDCINSNDTSNNSSNRNKTKKQYKKRRKNSNKELNNDINPLTPPPLPSLSSLKNAKTYSKCNFIQQVFVPPELEQIIE